MSLLLLFWKPHFQLQNKRVLKFAKTMTSKLITTASLNTTKGVIVIVSVLVETFILFQRLTVASLCAQEIRRINNQLVILLFTKKSPLFDELIAVKSHIFCEKKLM